MSDVNTHRDPALRWSRLASSSRDAIALHHGRNWLDSSGARATSVGLSALAVAGPVREQPRPATPPRKVRAAGTPGVLGEKRLSRLTPPRPAGRPRSRPPARG